MNNEYNTLGCNRSIEPDSYINIFEKKYLNNENIRFNAKIANRGRLLSRDFCIFNANDNIAKAKEFKINDNEKMFKDAYEASFSLAEELYYLLNSVDNLSINFSVSVIVNKENITKNHLYPQTLSKNFVCIKYAGYSVLNNINIDNVSNFSSTTNEMFINIEALKDALNHMGLKLNLYFIDYSNYERRLITSYADLDQKVISGNNVCIEVSKKAKERNRI